VSEEQHRRCDRCQTGAPAPGLSSALRSFAGGRMNLKYVRGEGRDCNNVAFTEQIIGLFLVV